MKMREGPADEEEERVLILLSQFSSLLLSLIPQ